MRQPPWYFPCISHLSSQQLCELGTGRDEETVTTHGHKKTLTKSTQLVRGGTVGIQNRDRQTEA